MNVNQLHEQYWFSEGQVKSFQLDIQNNKAEIELLTKRIINKGPNGQILENGLKPCTLRITFENLIELSLFDKFPTQGYYLDFNTYNNGEEDFAISLNVHDNSSYVYEKDNWFIKAKNITWKEIES